MKPKQAGLSKGIDFSKTEINPENLQTPEQLEHFDFLRGELEISKIRNQIADIDLDTALKRGEADRLLKHPDSYDDIFDKALRNNFEEWAQRLSANNEATNNKEESAIDITNIQNSNEEKEPQTIEENIKPKVQGKK